MEADPGAPGTRVRGVGKARLRPKRRLLDHLVGKRRATPWFRATVITAIVGPGRNRSTVERGRAVWSISENTVYGGGPASRSFHAAGVHSGRGGSSIDGRAADVGPRASHRAVQEGEGGPARRAGMALSAVPAPQPQAEPQPVAAGQMGHQHEVCTGSVHSGLSKLASPHN